MDTANRPGRASNYVSLMCFAIAPGSSAKP